MFKNLPVNFPLIQLVIVDRKKMQKRCRSKYNFYYFTSLIFQIELNVSFNFDYIIRVVGWKYLG